MLQQPKTPRAEYMAAKQALLQEQVDGRCVCKHLHTQAPLNKREVRCTTEALYGMGLHT